jgi:ABC-type lipoprotein release transport system permease subunit
MGADGAAVRLWWPSELRRRWPALVVLGVLAGLTGGLAMAAIDGARRTDSAYDRLHDEHLAADAVFFPSQVGVYDADVTRLGDLPEVEAWAGFASTFSVLDEVPDGAPLVAVGSDWFTTIERATVLEGRLPDPDRDDEAVITSALLPEAKAVGGGVGSVLTWRTLSPADVAAMGGEPPDDFDWTTATGPVTRLRIVGVVQLPMDSVLSFASTGLLLPSPGWAEAHLATDGTSTTGKAALGWINALVRLRDGGADMPAFQDGVAQLYGRDDIPVKDLRDDSKRVQRSLDVERTALLLFAGAVMLAALVLIGQAVVRSVRSGADAVPALRAIGFDRAGLTTGLVAPHVLAIAVAGLTAAVTAVALSTRFPIGLGRTLDPDLGVQFNGGLLAAGVGLTVALMGLACLLAAWSTVRRMVRHPRSARTQVVAAATRAGAPVPAAVGASLALEPAPTRSAAITRPALLAAVAGVVGVVGAVTLVRGVDDALHRPERVGQVWDLEATASEDMDLATAKAIVADNSDVDAFALRSRVPAIVDGKDIPLYSLLNLQGSLRFVVTSGRAPDGDDELALGPRTAALLGVGVGDTVRVGPSARLMEVVGISLLAQTPHTSFDEGAWLTPNGLDSVTGTVCCTGERDDQGLLQLRDGADVEAVVADLSSRGLWVTIPTTPPDVTNLGNVRSLPLFLAGFLVLLAVGAVAHALLTGARSRSRDLAVLRALGLTPAQAASCVTWQAATIGAVALLVGIPLGVVAGRQVWRLLADSLSFVYVGPIAGVALVILIPVALVVLGAMAVWPARDAARLRTTDLLRAE